MCLRRMVSSQLVFGLKDLQGGDIIMDLHTMYLNGRRSMVSGIILRMDIVLQESIV